jgi:glucose-1-phosphate thymidylyltransferase
MTRRAVILAAGMGTRMRRADGVSLEPAQARAADAGFKAMMPVGRPFIEYVLSALADAGIEQACLVVAPGADAVRSHFARAAGRRVQVEFAEQGRPLGTADAVLAAERFAGGEPFLVVNGDNLYPASVLGPLAALHEPAAAAFSRAALTAGGALPAERIARFALLEPDAEGYLRRIVEKPSPESLNEFGPEARVSMNCWRFDPSIFAACRAVPPSPRGELELPLAVQQAIETGAFRVRLLPVAETVLDLSSRLDVAAVTARLRGVTPRP